jgi:hypothetical protein
VDLPLCRQQLRSTLSERVWRRFSCQGSGSRPRDRANAARSRASRRFSASATITTTLQRPHDGPKRLRVWFQGCDYVRSKLQPLGGYQDVHLWCIVQLTYELRQELEVAPGFPDSRESGRCWFVVSAASRMASVRRWRSFSWSRRSSACATSSAFSAITRRAGRWEPLCRRNACSETANTDERCVCWLRRPLARGLSPLGRDGYRLCSFSASATPGIPRGRRHIFGPGS